MSIFTKIANFFKAKGHEIHEVLEPFEHDMLRRIHPLASQIFTVFGHQALDIAKEILEASFIALATGNWAAAIADAAPKLIKTAENDVHEDLHNAAYGALSIAQGELMAAGVGATAASAAATPPVPLTVASTSDAS